jgi:predicted nucleic acid-binding protein
MATKSDIIIADSSGLFSLVIPTDSNYGNAGAVASRLTTEEHVVLIPSEVLAETINILGKKFGHENAVQLIEGILESQIFLVTSSSDLARRDALELFRAAAAGVSYTDCLVMAVADHHDTRLVFGFDDIFHQRGYLLPGEPQDRAA